MPKKVFTKSFTKFERVCVALLEFKSRPSLDEGIFESYVHLNIVVPVLGSKESPKQYYCFMMHHSTVYSVKWTPANSPLSPAVLVLYDLERFC